MKKIYFATLLTIVSSVCGMNYADNYRLPSLCDEWNILQETFFPFPPNMYSQYLTFDTIIDGQIYSKLETYSNGKFAYEGALREGNNKDIYYIPNGSTHEYLLFAFNAKEGELLTNLWGGGSIDDYMAFMPQGFTAKITDIEESTPRVFVLDVPQEYYSEDTHVKSWTWIEGVGLYSGPVGWTFFPGAPVDPTPVLLCAYKNGEQVYMSEFGEEYGCYYDGEHPQATTWHCVSVYRDMFDYDNVYFSPATYQLQGDTLFGDTRYKTLRSENGTYCGAVRKTDDGQQVYYHPRGAERYPATIGKEYLLYDFSVKAGDTTVVYNGFMDIYNEEGNPYVHFTDSMVVVSVQVIDGRKHVLVQRLHETGQVEWIEGIGTRSVLFSCDRNVLPGNNWGLYTLCAADSEGNVLYSFDTDYLGIHNNQCQLEPLAIENVHTDSSSASKLLRDGQLIIEKNDKFYNAQGVLIK